MEKNGVLHDGEPQAGTAILPATSLAYTIETFENPVQVIFFYSLPRVIVGEIIKFIVFHVVVYPDRDIVSGVIDGIFNEIPEYSINQRFISLDNRLGIYLVPHVDPVCYDRVMQVINDLLQSGVNIHSFFVKKFGCLFRLGD